MKSTLVGRAQINEFNQSYVIVKGHIHHVQQKMHTMIEQVPIATPFPYLQQVLSDCPPNSAQQTASTTDALCFCRLCRS